MPSRQQHQCGAVKQQGEEKRGFAVLVEIVHYQAVRAGDHYRVDQAGKFEPVPARSGPGQQESGAGQNAGVLPQLSMWKYPRNHRKRIGLNRFAVFV